MIKQRIVLLGIILMLLLTTIAVNPVNASILNTTLTNWDDVASGVYQGTSGYIQFKNSSHAGITKFITSTEHDNSSPNSFHIDVDNGQRNDVLGWWNLTETYDYISDVCFGVYFDQHQTNGGIEMFFVNSSEIVLGIRFGYYTDYKVQYRDVSLGWQDIHSGIGDLDAEYLIIEITHNTTNIMNYRLYDDTHILLSSVTGASDYGGTWTNFSMINFSGSNGGSAGDITDCYFDDIQIEYGVFANECQIGYMTTQYARVGNIATTVFLVVENKQTIEYHYNVVTSMNITGIDLAVATEQYDYQPDTSYYRLYVNGNPRSMPNCFIQYSDYYVLRWVFESSPVRLSNEKLLIEARNTQDLGLSVNPTYWFIGVSYSDRDNDGDTQHRQSNTPNGIYDGVTSGLGVDACYHAYYDSINYLQNPDYSDIIGTDKYEYEEYEQIEVSGTVSDKSNTNYLKVYNVTASSEYTEMDLPREIDTEGYSFTEFININKEGTYNVTIYRNGQVRASREFKVVKEANPNYKVYTYPNPSKSGEKITVKYRYVNDADLDGAIFLSRFPYVSSDYIRKWDIEDNTSGNDDTFDTIDNVIINTEGTYYFVMAVEISANTYSEVSNKNGIHKHIVIGSYDNLIDTDKDSYILGESVNIFGEHQHEGGQVAVRVNDIVYEYVGNDATFSLSYNPSVSGIYQAKLSLVLANETYIDLANTTFTVIDSEDIDIIDNHPVREFFEDTIGEENLWMAGIGMVVIFMLLPFFIIVSINQKLATKDAVSLPYPVYIVFAGMGMAFAVYFELLPWYLLIFTIILICGILAVKINSIVSGGTGNNHNNE